MPLPPWVSHDEAKPAPMPLLLVQAFVNSRGADTDLLADPGSAQQWLAAAGLAEAADTLSAEELRTVCAVRECIRGLLAAHAGAGRPSDEDLGLLATLADNCRPGFGIDANGMIHLEAPAGAGMQRGWVRLLLIIRDAQCNGDWARLKVCENGDCRRAFYDRSHSRRGRWCDMAVCGNRMKNRSLRTRQRLSSP